MDYSVVDRCSGLMAVGIILQSPFCGTMLPQMSNPKDGLELTPMSVTWQFGPDWPGRRCQARTKRGTLCEKPALRDNARCQLHGGRGGAPSGRANAAWRHGRCTKERIAADRASMKRVRELAREARHLGMFSNEVTSSERDTRTPGEVLTAIRERLAKAFGSIDTP